MILVLIAMDNCCKIGYEPKYFVKPCQQRWVSWIVGNLLINTKVCTRQMVQQNSMISILNFLDGRKYGNTKTQTDRQSHILRQLHHLKMIAIEKHFLRTYTLFPTLSWHTNKNVDVVFESEANDSLTRLKFFNFTPSLMPKINFQKNWDLTQTPPTFWTDFSLFL